MHAARYKEIKNPVLLLQNSITIIFCTWRTLANKFLLICYCHYVEQTGCYRIILIKKQMLYHRIFTRDSTFSTTQSVTVILPIVSLRVTTLTSIFSSPLSRQDPSLGPLFFEIFPIPLSKPNFFNGTFFFLFNLKVKEKILIFDFLILNCVNFYAFSLLNKLLIK